MADDVQLTDLEVIQRYSLAVRGATASRDELVAALQADLDWLRGGRRPATPAKTAPTTGALAAPATSAAPVKAAAPAKTVPAKTAARPSSRAAAKRPAKRAGSA